MIAFHSLSHFTLTTPQLNLSFLKKFQLVQNHSETGTVFSQPPLISFKRYKNTGNFFWSKVHLKPKTSLKLSNVLALDAKTVLLFIT